MQAWGSSTSQQFMDTFTLDFTGKYYLLKKEKKEKGGGDGGWGVGL